MKKSWKTTAGGIAGILTSLALIAKGLADSDMSIVGAGIAAIWPSIAALFARDNDVSSQDVGIRPN